MKRKSIISLSRGFTMIEIVFVIVILGIFASLAVPRLATNKEDAQISQLKAQIAAIRAGIIDYANQQRLAGKSEKDIYPKQLENGEPKNRPNLFEYVLPTPIKSNNADRDTILKIQGWSDKADCETRYMYSTGNLKTASEVIVMVYCSPIITSDPECEEDYQGTFICLEGCDKIKEKQYKK
ncbi:type II secretion system protein [Campylobacter fetus]|uniref:type II secretion system protein n=1 Tax=Campylobacter fetus TaxID=196 RepID=UPI0003C2B6AD|nr:prepilin-type N-terminal cleavage/methylation domain-containing protein [Campylobacter fetus]AGZ81734.1 putative type II secretion system protein [Campylobacter fetus subsp. testudinum 03-427]EAI4321288.1 prepilin-type N-terminal cleavage/methylation domain-containing protein [Campylobacter fetus]EAI4390545.1 prepilin-type N-terminal cleavage/methylation domain-containing protein [Campylobacter fetus]OCS09162.1 hypothetical protein CFTD6683_01010 [Campylobacter fetus subsp. testudinum]OCS10